MYMTNHDFLPLQKETSPAIKGFVESLLRKETLSLPEKEYLLRYFFKKIAKVTNYNKAYISVPFVNQRVKSKPQKWAADLIISHMQIQEIEIGEILGIPTSGVPLATTIANKLDHDLVLGRKGNIIPGTWKNPLIIKETAPSFTTGQQSSFVFNDVPPKVCITDDVSAQGATLSLISETFEKKGIKPSFIALYFAKLFQPGIRRIYEETGIEPFYAVGVESITEKGEIVLAPPHFYEDNTTPTP